MKKSVLLMVLLCCMVAVPAGSNDCFSYPGTRVAYFSGCSCYACAYTGSGCTACTNGAGSCYTDGSTCEPGPLNQW